MAGKDPDDQKGPAEGAGGFTVEGDENIRMYHLLQLKYALKLEIKGLRHSQGSVYAYVKRTLGFKGTKQRVLDQLEALIEAKMREREQRRAGGLDTESSLVVYLLDACSARSAAHAAHAQDAACGQPQTYQTRIVRDRPGGDVAGGGGPHNGNVRQVWD